MGYTTDFIGHIDIYPRLNEHEMEYLSVFAKSRRYERVDGPYAVPGNPAAEEEDDSQPVEVYNTVAVGQPGFWCGWTPCWDGCCLAHDGVEKFYQPTRWMTYLIAHFLRPGAHASTSGLASFKDFSFDHELHGLVAACRRDNKELYLIRVEDNVVTEQILRPGDRDFVDLAPLAYESEIDRWRQRPPRPRPSEITPNVVRLRPRTTA
jgi:hypothetical protein